MFLYKFPINDQVGERRFHDAHDFKVTINIRSHKDTMKHIRAKLNSKQKILFRQTYELSKERCMILINSYQSISYQQSELW